MTGYKLSKVVNQKLTELNLKNIPAQMIYHYINKGYIESYEFEGQKLVTDEVATEWIEKYLEKRILKSNV